MGRLRATVDLMYPTPSSLKIVLAAGGVSKLTPAQRERVEFKRVKAGSYCDDLPAVSRAGLLASGQVTEVTAAKKVGERKK
jgi:hypothetical protein